MLDKGALKKDLIYVLAQHVGRRDHHRSALCAPRYSEPLAQMIEIVDDPNKYNAVVVMGTPGTGKTVCGLYATHYLLNEKNATVKKCLLALLAGPRRHAARRCADGPPGD